MNSVVVVGVLLILASVATVDWHVEADRAQQLNDEVELDVMVVRALQRVVVFHAVVVAVAAVEVEAVAIYDFDWPLLVQHFVTMFVLLGFAGNCDATYHRRVVE